MSWIRNEHEGHGHKQLISCILDELLWPCKTNGWENQSFCLPKCSQRRRTRREPLFSFAVDRSFAWMMWTNALPIIYRNSAPCGLLIKSHVMTKGTCHETSSYRSHILCRTKNDPACPYHSHNKCFQIWTQTTRIYQSRSWFRNM